VVSAMTNPVWGLGPWPVIEASSSIQGFSIESMNRAMDACAR
jgi:hypothetical protein